MKNIWKWMVSGVAFTLAFGTLLHFIFDWCGGTVASAFGAVNESLWEHLKLIFWPILIFGIIEYLSYGKTIKHFIPAKVLSLITGILTILMLFYTYSGILGYNILAVDIVIFVVAAALAYYIEYRLLTRPASWMSSLAAIIIALVIAAALIICFIQFTFSTPRLPLFQDPESGGYGIIYKTETA